MSQNLKNAPIAKPRPTSGPNGSIHLQAGLVLIVGAAAAVLFGGNGGNAPVDQPETRAALVRRAAPAAPLPEAPTTQLLGYVDATPGETMRTVGISAQPERRTAARVDSAAWSDAAAPTLPREPQFTAAAGPPPRAMMRPYAAHTGTPGESAERPGLTATPANAARKHVVRDGDTLGGLAEKYYGDARRFRELFAANRAVLTDPELLPIGVTLQIPAFEPTATRADAPPPTGARLVPQVLLRNP